MLAEAFLKPLGMSNDRLIKEIGVPAQLIGGILAGRRATIADTDLRLCRFLRAPMPAPAGGLRYRGCGGESRADAREDQVVHCCAVRRIGSYALIPCVDHSRYRKVLLTCVRLDGIFDGITDGIAAKVHVVQQHPVIVDDRVGVARRTGAYCAAFNRTLA
jgi:hypothetical protein